MKNLPRVILFTAVISFGIYAVIGISTAPPAVPPCTWQPIPAGDWIYPAENGSAGIRVARDVSCHTVASIPLYEGVVMQQFDGSIMVYHHGKLLYYQPYIVVTKPFAGNKYP